MIMKKYCDHGEILWSWRNIVIMEKDCDDWNLSNINVVIKTVLNFFYDKILHTQSSIVNEVIKVILNIFYENISQA